MMRKFAFALGVTTCCGHIQSAYSVKGTDILDDMPRGSIRKNIFDRTGVLHESRVRNNLLKPEMIPHNFPLFLKMSFPKLIADLKELNKTKTKKSSHHSSSKTQSHHSPTLANKKVIKRKAKAKARAEKRKTKAEKRKTKAEKRKMRKLTLAAKKKRISERRIKKQKGRKNRIKGKIDQNKCLMNHKNIKTKRNRNRVAIKKGLINKNLSIDMLLKSLRKSNVFAPLTQSRKVLSTPSKRKDIDQKQVKQISNCQTVCVKKQLNSPQSGLISKNKSKDIISHTPDLKKPMMEIRKPVPRAFSPLQKNVQESKKSSIVQKSVRTLKKQAPIQPAFKAIPQIRALQEAIKELEKPSSDRLRISNQKEELVVSVTDKPDRHIVSNTLASLHESDQMITRQRVGIENLELSPVIEERPIPNVTKTSLSVISEEPATVLEIILPFETQSSYRDGPVNTMRLDDSIDKKSTSILGAIDELSTASRIDIVPSRDRLAIETLEPGPLDKNIALPHTEDFEHSTSFINQSTIAPTPKLILLIGAYASESKEEGIDLIEKPILNVTNEADYADLSQSISHDGIADELRANSEKHIQVIPNKKVLKEEETSKEDRQVIAIVDSLNSILKIAQDFLPSTLPEAMDVERMRIEASAARIADAVKSTDPQDIEIHHQVIEPTRAVQTVIVPPQIEPISVESDKPVDETIAGEEKGEAFEVLSSVLSEAIDVERMLIEASPARIVNAVKSVDFQDIEIHHQVIEPTRAVQTVIVPPQVEPISTESDKPVDDTIAGKEKGEVFDVLPSVLLEAIDVERMWIETSPVKIINAVKSVDSQDIEVHHQVIEPTRAVQTVIVPPQIDPISAENDKPVDETITAEEKVEAYEVLPSTLLEAIDVERMRIEASPARIADIVNPTNPQDIEVHHQAIEPKKAVQIVIASPQIEPISAESETAPIVISKVSDSSQKEEIKPILAHSEESFEELAIDIIKSKTERFINAVSALNSNLHNLIQKIASLDPIESNPQSGSPLFIISFSLNLINSLLDKTAKELEISDFNIYSGQKEETFLLQLETLQKKLGHYISIFSTVDLRRLDTKTIEKIRKIADLSLYISPKLLEFSVETYLIREAQIAKYAAIKKEITLKTSRVEILSKAKQLSDVIKNFVFKGDDVYKSYTCVECLIPFTVSQISSVKNILILLERKNESFLKAYLHGINEGKLQYEILEAEGTPLQVKVEALRSGLDVLNQHLPNFNDVLKDIDFSNLGVGSICNLNLLESCLDYLISRFVLIKEKVEISTAPRSWPAAPLIAFQERLNRQRISLFSHNADDEESATPSPKSVQKSMPIRLDEVSAFSDTTTPLPDAIPFSIIGDEAETVISSQLPATESETELESLRREERADEGNDTPLPADLSTSFSPPLAEEDDEIIISSLHDEDIVSTSEHTFSSPKHIEHDPLAADSDDLIQIQEKARMLSKEIINLVRSQKLADPATTDVGEELAQLASLSGHLRQLIDHALQQDEIQTTTLDRASALDCTAFRSEMGELTKELVAQLKSPLFARNKKSSLPAKLCYISYLSNITTIQLRLKTPSAITADSFKLQEDKLSINQKKAQKKKSALLHMPTLPLLTDGVLAKIGRVKMGTNEGKLLTSLPLLSPLGITPFRNEEGAENRENGRLRHDLLSSRTPEKRVGIMPKTFTHGSSHLVTQPRTPFEILEAKTDSK